MNKHILYLFGLITFHHFTELDIRSLNNTYQIFIIFCKED